MRLSELHEKHLPLIGNKPINNILPSGRTVIPFVSVSDDVKKVVKDAGYDIDVGGLATKLIKTQMGEKTQKIKIGSLLSKIAPHLLDQWATSGTGFYIIISNLPIDLIRMSDFKSLQSCHSQGGQYFVDAAQEARNGGLVAYLIKSNDMSKIDITAPEIFNDEERGISGFEPICRMRIRKYVGKNGQEIYIPQDSVYGMKVPGFVETVSAWLKEKQEPPTDSHYRLAGGRYIDNSDAFNKEFGRSDFTFSKTKRDDDLVSALYIPHVIKILPLGGAEWVQYDGMQQLDSKRASRVIMTSMNRGGMITFYIGIEDDQPITGFTFKDGLCVGQNLGDSAAANAKIKEYGIDKPLGMFARIAGGSDYRKRYQALVDFFEWCLNSEELD